MNTNFPVEFTNLMNFYVSGNFSAAEKECVRLMNAGYLSQEIFTLFSNIRTEGLLVNLRDEISRNNQLSRYIAASQQQFYINQILSDKKYDNALRLEKYGFKCFSQNEEDGIIHEIFNRIGVANRMFFEFGVEVGLENNTHLLLNQGWEGAWIDGSQNNLNFIMSKFASAISTGKLRAYQSFVSRENINQIISELALPEEIDIISIDIDGNDYYVFEAIQNLRPRVVVIEYNAKFPPPIKWVMKYNPEFKWSGTSYFGASLSSMTIMAEKKGYTLVGTNITGSNAFYVRNDLVSGKFCEPLTPENLYNPARYQFSTVWNAFPTGHQSDFGIFENK